MRDDPGKTLKWLEQELLAEEDLRPANNPLNIGHEDPELLKKANRLLNSKRPKEGRPKGSFRKDPSEKNRAVYVKSRKQLRREARQQKKAAKKEKVNRKIGDLVFLAVLEIIGILCILGWWLL